MAAPSSRFEGWPVVAVATLIAAAVVALTDSVFLLVLVAVGWAFLVGPWIVNVVRPGGGDGGAHARDPGGGDGTDRG